MVLSEDVRAERVSLGMLDGQDTCALCRERPLVLVDVARAPILLCAAHAREASANLAADLRALGQNT